MFEKPLLISGLNRQIDLLGELLQQMEERSSLKSEDNTFFYDRTRHVAQNLRKLRQIERNYRFHLGAPAEPDYEGFTGWITAQ
ncbi:MAG TPA: hypothetical protein VL688_10250 [Verrucomicrobiae bacterium]|nr:hypothetical protein [Verrucomicrobiae bacterium]